MGHSAIKACQSTYGKYDIITRRWWFFVSLLLIQLVPPFTSKNFNYEEIYEIIRMTLSRALVFSFKETFPVFQIIAIFIIVLLIVFRSKVRVVLAIYAGLSYLLFAAMQFVAVTPEYGLSIISSGVIMFGLVAAVWFWEAFAGFNDFSSLRQPAWKYTVLIPAIIAFWMPINWTTGGVDFALANFITSGSSLMFCLMTPVYLAVLMFFYPTVNIVLLRVTSTVGIIIAIYNAPKLFSFDVIWLGILHLPLFFLSIMGFIMSMGRNSGQCCSKKDQLKLLESFCDA
jgi:hypothetical protein